jgi:hypothetical protein
VQHKSLDFCRFLEIESSGRKDLNLRPLGPEPSYLSVFLEGFSDFFGSGSIRVATSAPCPTGVEHPEEDAYHLARVDLSRRTGRDQVTRAKSVSHVR